MAAKSKIRPPIHPGEFLREEFMEPLGLGSNKLAKECGLAVTRINDIVRGRRGITAETALALAQRFEMTPEFWMNLQTYYDLEIAKDKFAEKHSKSKPFDSIPVTKKEGRRLP